MTRRRQLDTQTWAFYALDARLHSYYGSAYFVNVLHVNYVKVNNIFKKRDYAQPK